MNECKRLHIIEGTAIGWFKVEARVGAAFYAIPLEQKETFLRVALAFRDPNLFYSVDVIDHETGITIGSYSLHREGPPFSGGFHVDQDQVGKVVHYHFGAGLLYPQILRANRRSR